MSYLSDYIAQRRLDLQMQSQSLNERKFANEQANFERKMQADFENEQRKNEASIQIAKIQAQNNLELMAVQNLLSGLNETQKFFLFARLEDLKSNFFGGVGYFGEKKPLPKSLEN